MARYLRILLTPLAVVLMVSSLAAQDDGIPDTVYYGDDGKAYSYPDGIFRVPVYITTDRELSGISLGMEFGLGYMSPTADSAGTWGSIFMEDNYLDLTGVLLNDYDGVDGVMPDTVLVGGAAMMKPLPAGKYKFCDIWFTGGTAGQQFLIDSAWVPPSGEFMFFPDLGGPFVPEFVTEPLTLEDGGPIMYPLPPPSPEGNTGALISFDIEVIGTHPPFTVVLDSMKNVFIGVRMIDLPPTSGTNPLTVEWTPRHEHYGEWDAYYTATDATEGSIQISNQITVYYDGPECGLNLGDVNTDCQIDIDDAVFLIDYIFNFGPEPTKDE